MSITLSGGHEISGISHVVGLQGILLFASRNRKPASLAV